MASSKNDVHAKILRSGQYTLDTTRYVVQAPRIFKKTKDQEVDESAKRIDDLREEIRKLEAEITAKMDKSEKEAEDIVDKAEQEAERIVKEAEKTSFDRVKKSLDEKDTVLTERKNEADTLLKEAQNQAQEIISSAQAEADKIRQSAKKEGFTIGQDQGFAEGKVEIVSMTQRLRAIINVTLEEREKILFHSENQIINLIITMVKKIVKRLTQEEQTVVVNNTKEALKLIRGASRVYIHVNPSDYEFTAKHKDELIKLIEGMPEVKFLEDPTVDRGGVYIETDVGEIDARIATQLEEILDRIKFYMPMKVKAAAKEKEAVVDQNIKEETMNAGNIEVEKSAQEEVKDAEVVQA